MLCTAQHSCPLASHQAAVSGTGSCFVYTQACVLPGIWRMFVGQQLIVAAVTVHLNALGLLEGC